MKASCLILLLTVSSLFIAVDANEANSNQKGIIFVNSFNGMPVWSLLLVDETSSGQNFLVSSSGSSNKINFVPIIGSNAKNYDEFLNALDGRICMLFNLDDLELINSVKSKNGFSIAPQGIHVTAEENSKTSDLMMLLLNSWGNLIPVETFGGGTSSTSQNLLRLKRAASRMESDESYEVFFESFLKMIVSINCRVKHVSASSGYISLEFDKSSNREELLQLFYGFFSPLITLHDEN